MSTIENKKINTYLDEVCSFIENKKIHITIRAELLCHIEDIIDSCIDKGMTEDTAINYALDQMGAAKIVGQDLNKAHKTNSDYLLMAMTTILIFFGLLITGFLQSKSIIGSDGLSINYFGKTLLFLTIAVLISLVTLKLDYRKIKKFSYPIYFATLALIILTNLISPVINGARGWINLGAISINVLSISPILLIIALAGIFTNYNWNDKKPLCIGITLVLVPVILLTFTPSLSTAIIYLIGAGTVMVVSGFKIKHLIILCFISGASFMFYIFGAAYRLERLFIFLNPSKDIEGSGWLYNKLTELRHSAGLFGNSSNITNTFIPEANMDFALTSIIYCFGWITFITLIALVLSFIIRIGFIGANTKNTYGKLLVMGICSLFTVQFILSILANLSLLPIINASTPFISYSNSQLFLNILSISIINNVYKYRNSTVALIN